MDMKDKMENHSKNVDGSQVSYEGSRLCKELDLQRTILAKSVAMFSSMLEVSAIM